MNEMTPQLSDHRQQAMSYLQGLPEGDGCWLMDQRQAAPVRREIRAGIVAAFESD